MLMHIKRILAASVVISAVLAQETVCNGYAELCDRKYSNVTSVGAHDSPFIGNSSMTNQDWGVSAQLDHGARMLQGQIHRQGQALHLCHTNCFIHDGGSLLDYLTQVKTWLDKNPREVLTLLFTNSDSIGVEIVKQPFVDSGILDMAYHPQSPTTAAGDWPTLASLISTNQRVVIFMDYHADHSKVPQILDEFSHFWEDPYNAVESTWPCTRDRGDSSSGMYIHNHFLDKKETLLGTDIFTPDTDKLTTTNAASGEGSLGAAIDNCVAKHTQPPTFVLVDYESHGNGSVYEAAAAANGVQYVAKGDIHPPTPAQLSHEMDDNAGEDTSDALAVALAQHLLTLTLPATLALSLLVL
ncbi:hypothetical protein E3P99_00033 [Wallemia hederae]|uniref:Phosphatidylinositol-specific phospholipase C X domain-containing protein n=1 Tax=Wallemia hederae TaxID=1540922 RepID=A0A4T0G0F7_9BASI|nr:hypothetical protein E3P99_00033 [Wallemia hederae]